MVDYRIESYNWDDIVDYESDENSVDLINSDGKTVARFSYVRFTRQDFENFKNN
jgi:hypothetical protein